MCSTTPLLLLLSLFFPPLPVWIKRGLCSADSLINIALCMLGVLPGLFHAWYIILATPDYEYEYVPIDVERQAVHPSAGGAGTGGTSVYYVQMPGQHGSASGGAYPGAAGYGTVGGEAAPPRYEDAVKKGGVN